VLANSTIDPLLMSIEKLCDHQADLLDLAMGNANSLSLNKKRTAIPLSSNS
jgi:hypothetical protein